METNWEEIYGKTRAKKQKKIDEARAEAKRFLARCTAAERELKEGDMTLPPGHKHWAAMKRASLDLSQELVNLRSGGSF